MNTEKQQREAAVEFAKRWKDKGYEKGESQRFWLDLLGNVYGVIVDTGSEHIRKEMEVSMKAGEIVGKIYDAFIKEYDKNDPKSLRYLNILCVRLVFCLYAEDAGIFGKHDIFHDYLQQFPTAMMRDALINLFNTLNTPKEKRSKYINKDLAAFPYTNGGLFAEEIDIPPFTDEIRAVLLLHASLDFDWSEISPTIFGGVFESTLNPETRRKGGMHYTSIENIHKVIDPLFLDDLKREFEEIKEESNVKVRLKKLHAFQDKIASLTFFDPACGSGNFLTETYLSLRRLENEVIKEIYSVEPLDAFTNPIKVSIDQFFGIEINDFAVTVATTALWISESQMMAETERIVHHDIDFLPLKSYANIREGNALRMDWNKIELPDNTPTIHARNTYVVFESPSDVASEPTQYENINLITTHQEAGPKPIVTKQLKSDYIIGNPPFVGYTLQSKSQKEDLLNTFVDFKGKPYKGVAKMDYVSAWYYKASQMMKGTNTRAALVSTNSITQGEQVAAIWKPLKEMFGVHIDFAYRTFRWDSEATLKAQVHVVVIGFSCSENTKTKLIFDNGRTIEANNINAYLYDAPDVFIGSRSKSLCNVPMMMKGSQPTDNGNLIIEADEYEKFIKECPAAVKFIHPFIGSKEFINNLKRYCLWLVDATPAELRKMPQVMKRIEAVKEFRLKSSKEATRRKADLPWLFDERRASKDNYILVPRVSSERRRYNPMGFVEPNVIASDSALTIPNATLYHFGVLESNVHMAWMRVVCGRLKSDYRYSKDVVYNNFPWPHCGDALGVGSATKNDAGGSVATIEKTAQAILDVRAKYPDSSLADLYDPTTMPYDLLEAHRANDRAVMSAYGFSTKMTESECVSRLFGMYAEMTKTKKTY